MTPFQSLDQVRAWADFCAQGDFSVLIERRDGPHHLTCVGHRPPVSFDRDDEGMSR